MKLTSIARKLRKDSTPHEVKLWSLLRDKHFQGLKFRRQYPIGKYIVDFCCSQKKLIIELDGGGHNEEGQIKRDKERDTFLIKQGFIILRIWNNELEKNLEGVLDKIDELLNR